MGTLYRKLKFYEGLSKKNLRINLNRSFQFSLSQKYLMKEHERNPVFYDAITNKQTITESLEEIAKNKKEEKRQIISGRKNKSHNERLYHLGNLVTECPELQLKGIVNIPYFLFSSPIIGTISSIVGMPKYSAATIGISIGLIVAMIKNRNTKKTNRLPFEQTHYLDQKIKAFYK